MKGHTTSSVAYGSIVPIVGIGTVRIGAAIVVREDLRRLDPTAFIAIVRSSGTDDASIDLTLDDDGSLLGQNLSFDLFFHGILP